ncbi:hypothetical protein EVG20_g1531 [Dentipellis fragilis]|uniref:Uncharacterized protein n=1 Tax=Dentipellis fragilis TaxID=205917 RepID=A0A4Y9ZCD2_9AGAM|nr:hypothetical protein EVG20_g1531 [Dentipellis fragilis]
MSENAIVYDFFLSTRNTSLFSFQKPYHVFSQADYRHSDRTTIGAVHAAIEALGKQSNGSKIQTLELEVKELQNAIDASVALEMFHNPDEWVQIHKEMTVLLETHLVFQRWNYRLDKTQRFFGFWKIRSQIKRIQKHAKNILLTINMANTYSLLQKERHLKEQEEQKRQKLKLRQAVETLKQVSKQMQDADDKDIREHTKGELEIIMKMVAAHRSEEPHPDISTVDTGSAPFMSAHRILLAEEESTGERIGSLYEEMLRDGGVIEARGSSADTAGDGEDQSGHAGDEESVSVGSTSWFDALGF